MKIKQVACGCSFSLVLTDDNVLYSFGEYEKLGIGDPKYRAPKCVTFFDKIPIKNIYAGR